MDVINKYVTASEQFNCIIVVVVEHKIYIQFIITFSNERRCTQGNQYSNISIAIFSETMTFYDFLI